MQVNRWWLGGTAGLIVAGAIGIGAAMAQESPTPQAATTQETPAGSSTPNASGTPSDTTPNTEPGQPGGDMRGGCAGGHFVGADEMATFLGADADTLRTELQADGATLASVAASHGKSRDELKSFLTGQAQQHLAGEVTEGDLTQAEADQKLADFTANLDSAIDASPPRIGGHGHHRGPGDGENGSGDTTPTGTSFSTSRS